MQRREALELTATIIGSTIFGSDVFLSERPVANTRQQSFSEADFRLLDAIGETILPDSERSPGAKAAQIGKFMTTVGMDCYDEAEAEIFTAGLREVRNDRRQSMLRVSWSCRLGNATIS